MLASIGFDSGVVTVIGSSQDDIVVIANSGGIRTNISVNANETGSVIRSFANHQINQIVVYAGAGNDSVFSTALVPTRLLGQDGDDNLNGGFAADVIYGQAGNDRINGRFGDDRIFGGDGDDRIFGENGRDRILGGAGDDYIQGHAGDDFISGGEGGDTLLGSNGNDEIHGGEGDDEIFGHSGSDRLFGSGGEDSLFGGTGDDFLNGGAQIDFVAGNSGADVFVPHVNSEIFDRVREDAIEVSYSQAGVVTYNYGTGAIHVFATEGDDTIRFFRDRIVVNDLSIRHDVRGLGPILVSALGGDDDIRQQFPVSSQTPQYYLDGGAGDDILHADSFLSTLIGGPGNDRLIGRGGSTRYVFEGEGDLGFDVIGNLASGGTIDFSGLNLQTGVTIDLDNRNRQAVASNTIGTRKLDLLVYDNGNHIDDLVGTSFDDVFSGSYRRAEGGLGDDVYQPASGLSGGRFTIVESVGEGFDTVDYSRLSRSVVVDLESAPDISVERVIGSNFDDLLTHNAHTRELSGGQGSDTYRLSDPLENGRSVNIIENAGQGGDTIDYSGRSSAVDVDLRDFPEIENLIGTNFADRLVGNAKDNQILGGAGDDFIEGREGIDDLKGQSGNDTYNIIPGEEVAVSDIVDDDADSILLPETDNDGDGLLPSEERVLGSDPDVFDSDGDGLGDGFEDRASTLDPLTPNDSQGDSDGDGLTELEEQTHGTDPGASDTDGDGVSDAKEVNSGSDPTDATDGGQRSEEDVEISLTIIERSRGYLLDDLLDLASNCEQCEDGWSISLGNETLHDEEVGRSTTEGRFNFSRGETGATYTGQVAGNGLENEENPIFSIGTVRWPIIVDDRVSMVFDPQNRDAKTGDTFKVHTPRVDLDIVGSEIRENFEAVGTGYDTFFTDSNSLIQLKLHKSGIAEALSEFDGAISLNFDTSSVRIWKTRDQNPGDEVSLDTVFEIDQDHSLFVERLGAGETDIAAVLRFDSLPEGVTAVGTAEDTVRLRIVAADLDIRLHGETYLAESDEDNPGVKIDLGADKDELARLNIRSLIPEALDSAFNFFTFDFDDTILKLWSNVEGEEGLDAFEEVTLDTVFNEADTSHSVWVEGFEVGATTISLVWHSSSFADDEPIVFDSVKVNTVGFRDVDILLAIGGTGSGPWLNSGDPSVSPGGTGKTVVGNRWLSHLRNWADERIEGNHGDGEEDRVRYLPGPGTSGSESPQIIEDGYLWLSNQFWDAVRKGAQPKVDIIGMSRGGMIASEIAWKIHRDGFVNNGAPLTSEDDGEVRFLGLYDPVDQAFSVTPEEEISPNVEHSVSSVATNFSGNDPYEISRFYWSRIDYTGTSIPTKRFVATHSAFQGAPTYSTDPGNILNSSPLHDSHPSDWLEGYTDEQDILGSIAVDEHFRSEARSVFVPIEFVENYFFGLLHSDPNSESPHHNQGYSQ